MFEKAVLDLVDPFLVSSVLLFEVIVVVIEAILIHHLLAKGLVKAFVSSIIVNLVTGLLSLIYVAFLVGVSLTDPQLVLMIVVSLLINIFMEAGLLRLLYKAATAQKILLVSTIMNIASYSVLILNQYWQHYI